MYMFLLYLSLHYTGANHSIVLSGRKLSMATCYFIIRTITSMDTNLHIEKKCFKTCSSRLSDEVKTAENTKIQLEKKIQVHLYKIDFESNN